MTVKAGSAGAGPRQGRKTSKGGTVFIGCLKPKCHGLDLTKLRKHHSKKSNQPYISHQLFRVAVPLPHFSFLEDRNFNKTEISFCYATITN